MIHITYPTGTHTIHSDASTSGIDYHYRDVPINAHIITDEGYELYITHEYITLYYKYITLTNTHIDIGRHKRIYPNDLHNYKGKERKHISRLCELINEVLTHHTYDGMNLPVPIERMLGEGWTTPYHMEIKKY